MSLEIWQHQGCGVYTNLVELCGHYERSDQMYQREKQREVLGITKKK